MKFEATVKKKFTADVLVVGGGVAGFATAIAAAREGASVILTEENGYLGGTAIAGLVAPFMTSYDTLGENQIIKGIFSEFVDRLAALGGAIHPAECRKCDSFSGYKLSGHLGTTPVDKEKIKILMERMCAEAGVELKYHYLFIGTEVSDRKITACHFATSAGIYRIEAKEIIDCTGSAAVCCAAGGECMFSDENGALQPVTTFFLIDGVDKEKLDKAVYSADSADGRAFTDLVRLARERGEFPCGTQKVRLYEQPNGIWAVNMCQINEPFDVTDPDLITKAEIEGRRQADLIFAFLKKYIPGLENAKMLQTSERVGIRESRRMAGEYVLTKEDIQSSTIFDDAVVILANSIDVHTPGKTTYKTFKNTEPYSIPYRALVSKDFDNLFTAGKSVSADRSAHGAVRVIPPCFAMGQAVGIASAMAAKESIAAKNVNVPTLQAKLRQNGAYLI